jgi:mRNA interferase RelE/StbE
LAWTIELTDEALRQLEKMGRSNAVRIREYLRKRVATLDNPRLLGKPLQGGALGHLWRYRVGDFRVLCELRDAQLVVLIVEIGHRREIYR